jgi:hypothetical protein
MDATEKLKCACGCGEWFFPLYENQIYFNRLCSNRARQRRHAQRERERRNPPPSGPPNKPPTHTSTIRRQTPAIAMQAASAESDSGRVRGRRAKGVAA